MKLCIDCAHYGGADICARHGVVGFRNPVTGEEKTALVQSLSAKTERLPHFGYVDDRRNADMCGIDAVHFKHRPPQNLGQQFWERVCALWSEPATGTGPK